MAGFEVVVRPVITPSIRPAPARSLPPEDDPAKGICEIKGTGSHPISLSHSSSVSWSQTKPVETERRVDTARVYQEDDDGEVNRDNFVDIEVANRINMKDAQPGFNGDDLKKTDGKGYTGDDTPFHYDRVKERPSSEIKARDKIIKSKK